ncbi:MAG: 4-hydroxy-3-methylbut-2-enyl diphosphate reductase [Mariprofundaceae bacterium]
MLHPPKGRRIRVLLAQPRGFCAGVVRAIEIVERALELFGAPVFVLHEIVHNPRVLQSLSRRGAVFVEKLDDAPNDSVVIFSAHGVAQSVAAQAHARRLHVIDATCPLVAKVHAQARRYSRDGLEIIIIGHAGHPEVQGTLGQISGPAHVIASGREVENLHVHYPELLAYVTQTTLSLDDARDVIAALRQRFPGIRGPELDGICYATQNRQRAIRQLAAQADIVLVVGARNSSNCNRLREVAEQAGALAYLIQDAAELLPEWLAGRSRIAITSGASTPEVMLREVLAKLGRFGMLSIAEASHIRETVTFQLPEGLEKEEEDVLNDVNIRKVL